MLKSISLLLLSAVAALAQISGAGQMGCNAATTTGTAWNSSTTSNSTQTIATSSPFAQWVIVLDQTTTLTGGAITVEGDYGDGNFVTAPAANLFNASTMVQVSNPYTVQASTNVQWILTMGGMKTARIRLSTTISGTGTVTPFFTGLCTPVFPSAVYTSSLPTLSTGQGAQLQLDAKGQQLQDLNYIAGAAIDTNNGATSAATQRVTISNDSTGQVKATNWPTTVDTNSGNKSASTPRVVIATDQPNLTSALNVALAANQSVNTAQVNGVTTLTGAGATGTGSQRETVAQDTTTIAGSAPGTAGTASSNVVTIQGIASMTAVKVDGSATNQPVVQGGNFQVRVQGNAGAAMDAAGQNASSPANSLLIGGQFNTSPTTITSGNMSPLQLGNNGHLLVTPDANSAVAATLSAETTKVIGTARVIGNAGATLDQAPGSAAPTNALQIGGTDGTNTRVHYMDPCEFQAWTYFPINVSSNTQIVAGSSSKNVYICKMFLAPVAAAANVNIVESATSGNACATSPAGMMGGNTAALGAQNAANGGFVLPADSRAWMKTATAADAVCIFASAQVTGVIAYVQF